MEDLRRQWVEIVTKSLGEYAEASGIDKESLDPADLVVETPPNSDLGDLAFPMFPFARIFRTNPLTIAAGLAETIENQADAILIGNAESTGPYVNIKYNRSLVFKEVIEEVLKKQEDYGKSLARKNERLVIEFSAPNTNKPLHLGHLRNDAIGISVSNILEATGAEMRRVNLINDRGIHICQSMLAYLRFGEGETPERAHKKSDHFVGDYYVRFNRLAESEPEAVEEAREILKKWEAGDRETYDLWKRMNSWAIEGIEETYHRTAVHFDKIYLESETYLAGKEEVKKGLEKGIFYQEEDGSIWVDLSEIDLDKKVLLRADGTSLYVTQDLGTAIARYRDWPFTGMIYVVGSEQNYHFRVLFHVLKKLGFDWADHLYHLSYGMVNLPEGKMKSREGTVVDADDLLDRLKELAADEIKDKEREAEVGDIDTTSEKIALGALHYYLLQSSPSRDMVFNPAESISFNGNTGPYLQYMGARISSMFRKYGKDPAQDLEKLRTDLLEINEEWDLIKLIGDFPERIEKAAETMDPSELTNYLYDIAKLFSRYYHDHPILKNEDPALRTARLLLSRSILQVFKNAFALIGVPFLDKM